MGESYQLMTATRYDKRLLDIEWNTRVNGGTPSHFLLLNYHLDRLIEASKRHGWPECLPSLTIGNLTSVCEDAVRSASTDEYNGPFKLRILLTRESHLTATPTPIEPFYGPDPISPSESPQHIRTIYIDTHPTPSSIFTSTKTTNRPHYAAARQRVKLGPIPTSSDSHIDVVLYTPDGQLTETSLRNISFKRNGVWVTPIASSSGCLPGTIRRLLMDQGKLVEGEIKKEDVVDGELVMTSNSAEGCVLGRIYLSLP